MLKSLPEKKDVLKTIEAQQCSNMILQCNTVTQIVLLEVVEVSTGIKLKTKEAQKSLTFSTWIFYQKAAIISHLSNRPKAKEIAATCEEPDEMEDDVFSLLWIKLCYESTLRIWTLQVWRDVIYYDYFESNQYSKFNISLIHS